MTVLVDTHVLLWWSQAADRLSVCAQRVIGEADEIAVSGMSWFGLAWLAHRGRVVVTRPVDSWLAGLAAEVRTAAVTWAVARTAAGLPDAFPWVPADRIIDATAMENGWQLVTKDPRLRSHPAPREVAVW